MNFSILLALCLVALQGCALLRPSPHNHMAQQLENYTYPMSLPELKAKLLENFDALYSPSGPMIVFDVTKNFPPSAPGTKSQLAMESGFTYAGKFYQAKTHEINLSDFQEQDLPSHWKKKFEELFFSNEFHLVKDEPGEFILVRSADIFIGRAVGPRVSRLEVKGVIQPVRGPLKLSLKLPEKFWDVKWWHFLKIEESPVILEKTLEHAVAHPARALAVFYLLQPEEASRWESAQRN